MALPLSLTKPAPFAVAPAAAAAAALVVGATLYYVQRTVSRNTFRDRLWLNDTNQDALYRKPAYGQMTGSELQQSKRFLDYSGQDSYRVLPSGVLLERREVDRELLRRAGGGGFLFIGPDRVGPDPVIDAALGAAAAGAALAGGVGELLLNLGRGIGQSLGQLWGLFASRSSGNVGFGWDGTTFTYTFDKPLLGRIYTSYSWEVCRDGSGGTAYGCIGNTEQGQGPAPTFPFTAVRLVGGQRYMEWYPNGPREVVRAGFTVQKLLGTGWTTDFTVGSTNFTPLAGERGYAFWTTALLRVGDGASAFVPQLGSLTAAQTLPEPAPAATPVRVPTVAPTPAYVPAEVPGALPVTQPAPATTSPPATRPATPGIAAPTVPGLTPRPVPLPGTTQVDANGPVPLPAPRPAATPQDTIRPWPGAAPIKADQLAPQPTPEGTARKLGELEGKLDQIGNMVQNGGGQFDLGGLLNTIGTIISLLTGDLAGGEYAINSVCNVDESGQQQDPLIAAYGGGFSTVAVISNKVDAIAELLQHHKNLPGETCRPPVQTGEWVTVQFEET